MRVYNGQKKGVYMMKLYDLIFEVLRQVEREKGNFGEKEKVDSRVDHILENSSIIYDQQGLHIFSSSKLGIEPYRDVELELPPYLLFTTDLGYKEWELKTLDSIEDMEDELNYLEDFQLAVAVIDGKIRAFNLIEESYNSRVIWQDTIYLIHFKENGEESQKFIYERTKLEDEIIGLVKAENIEDIKVFNIYEGMFEHFYVKDVVYSSSENYLPAEVVWGISEPSFFHLAE